MKAKNRRAEVIVHIHEQLEEPQRTAVADRLRSNMGIFSAEFCPFGYHLMLVRYDRQRLNSFDILSSVREQNLNARLIGPV